MSDFKAKMHQIRFRLGLRPRPRWGSLQRSPRPPSWYLRGILLWEGKGTGREGGEGIGRGEGRGGREREGALGVPPPNFEILATPLTTTNNTLLLGVDSTCDGMNSTICGELSAVINYSFLIISV